VAVVLIGGGCRSGKSRHALRLARERGGRMAFLATAEILDEEMRARALEHQRERGEEFVVIEEPRLVAETLALRAAEFDVVVVDCLTLWLSNRLLAADGDPEAAGEELIRVAAAAPCVVYLVTNEVGCGIVPENELARRFRDLAGRLNQRAAEAAVEVHWMVFGIPMKVK